MRFVSMNYVDRFVQRLGRPTVNRDGRPPVFFNDIDQITRHAIRFILPGIPEDCGNADEVDVVLLREQQNRQTVVRISPLSLPASRIGVDPDPDRRDGKRFGGLNLNVWRMHLPRSPYLDGQH